MVMLIGLSVLQAQTSFTRIDLGLGIGLDKAAADYDNDGDVDLLTCNGLYRNEAGVFTLMNGIGIPTLPVGTIVRWIDFNNDGHLDLFVGNNSNIIYLNNQGIFSPVNVGLPNLDCYDVEFGDYDNDGDLDVILMGTFYNSKIYENVNGSYVYVNFGIDNPYAGGCDWGDYDNDGDLDLVMTGRMGDMRIYRNDVSPNGVRSFFNAINLPRLEGSDVEWGDYDGDGDLDILVIGEVGDYSSNYTWVYQNNNGTFTNINAPLVGANYGNVAWFDLDNDGDLDIIAGGLQNEAANPDIPYTAIYINNDGLYSMLMDFPYQSLGISVFDYDSDGDLDIYLKYNWSNAPNSWQDSSVLLRNEFVPPGPPVILSSIDPISIYMNDETYLDLSEHFSDIGSALEYETSGNVNIVVSIVSNTVFELSPVQNWYGTEYLTIRATNQWGLYVEQVVKITVLQTWTSTENFDHSGALAANWTVQHSGTVTFPWQPILQEGDDYAMETMATTGGTANERLLSPAYNLSNYKDIQVSFDTSFLPYGSGSGTFAYTLNNVTYSTVETFSASTSGIKTYTLPALDAKPSVRFRWNYVNSTANTGQENYWTVDDFTIFGLVRDQTAPQAVSEFTLESQDNHSAQFSWEPSSDTYFGKYELYISTDSNVSTADQLWSVSQDPSLYNVNTIQTTIDPLADGEYWIAIRAVDQSNNASPLSAPVYVRIDGLGPLFTEAIPAGQPEPMWANSRTVTLGCSINDLNTIDPSTIQYRIDANGNGLYDEGEAWQSAAEFIRLDRNTMEISLETEYLVDGVLAFEFKAADSYGNLSYSGMAGEEGITDDWVVRIDTTPPQIFDPIPSNQPEPAWMLRNVSLGCSISDVNPIALVEYRFDSNGNGSYDAEEAWQEIDPESRNMLEVSQPVIFAADGLCHFEFRATDALGNVAYSGTEGSEGIADDWIVRIDTAAPTFIDPVPGNQPSPEWYTSLTVDIGATAQDLNDIDNIMYRYDANGNGSYDDDEIWQTLPRNLTASRERSSDMINLQITLPSDGTYHFEFKATDSLGNTGFSGAQGLEGIEDDWIVKIDTVPPAFTQPIPTNQPLPAWSNSRSLLIGATISEIGGVDASSIMYRIDANLNGVYDSEETWQLTRAIMRSGGRDAELSVSIPISVPSDGVYKFEIKAADLSGAIGYSGNDNLEGIEDDWVFRVDTTPPSEITNFFVQDVYDDSILLSWSASADENFASYQIYYATEANVSEADFSWNSEDDPILAIAGEGIVSTTITGLLPSTRYYFIIQAIDEVGWINQYPQTITGMTSSSYPPQMPQNLLLSVLGYDLLLTWDDVTTDTFGNPIEISYYEVHVGDQPYFDCNPDTLIATLEETELTLEGVAEFADRLFFKVIAVSGMIRISK
ncbi:MAG: FG-GAP-like repeat-containing protein [Candidatus Cloacimonetes bacterium]|jgi:hypothetical protein|nr:FG-GAP-like repeat-containing protein [Candidatus Cloacimonadota bacterium]